MRQLFILIPTLFCSFTLFSQAPVNDDCSGLIDLGTAPACPTTIYTNVNATNSNIGFDNAPTCFQSQLASRDVWFSFTCPNNLFDLRVSIEGAGSTPIKNPQVAIYRGDCLFDNLAQYNCVKSDLGSNSVYLDLSSLTPTLQYFVRVSDYPTSGVPNAGDFTICVDEIPSTVTIGNGSSVLSNGTIYDTGGSNGTYSANENHTFSICPPAPAGCIEFTLEYFNIEEADYFLGATGDQLAFFDGPTADPNTSLGTINGSDFGDISGGGGVCFRVTASSGCLTLAFTSDTTVQLDGFKGSWKTLTGPCPAVEPLFVNSNINNSQLVTSVANPSNTVSIVSVNCPGGSYGTFNYAKDNSDLGIQKGIVLTSGLAQIAAGPNTESGAGEDSGAPGDPDLDYLSETFGDGEPSQDACVVELDVFVRSDELTFEYVFGSEEYTEFVDEGFNDIFAFLISGPGIVGDPNLGGAKNIAVLPDANNTLVEINSVNNSLNWEYYRNNELGQSVQYDGLTSDKLGVKKSLTAKSKVTPCNTYRLKLAIGDRGDGLWDSGVFIAEIQAGAPQLTVQFASGINYMTESCSGTSDVVLITLPEASTDTVRYNVTIGGNATLGIDYTLNIPSVITFLPGETQASFPIVPIADGIAEGSETITITLTNNFGCGPVTYASTTIDLRDNVEVQVSGGDTIFVCQGNSIQLFGEGATAYFWQPTGAFNNPNLPNPTITPTQDIWVQVTGTLGTCVDIDSALLRLVDPMVFASPDTVVKICQGASVQLQSTNNVNNTGLIWSPSAGLNDPNIPNPVATPTVTTTYTVAVTVAGCTATDTVTIYVDTLFMPELAFADTIVCQNFPVVLAENTNSSSSTYVWSPGAGLSSTSVSNPTATPDATTTYSLVGTSANAYCKDTVSLQVTVTPADVTIAGADSLFICLGSQVPLSATASPAGSDITWAPSFYLNTAVGNNVVANPDESITVKAFYNINGCNVVDSVFIRVDSLPANSLSLSPVKPFYCPGDTIYILSPTYEPANFPDLNINWPMVGGEQTPDSLWNMVIIAIEGTFTYTRFIDQNACSDTSNIEVVVSPEVTVTVTGNPDICQGGSTQLNATSNVAAATFEWMPSNGLSCTECANPIASPTNTTTYTIVSKGVPCPGMTSFTVNVDVPPAIVAPDPAGVCPGGSVLLNNAQDVGQTYNWSGPGITDPSFGYPVVSPLTNATYQVTVTSTKGCSLVETLNINAPSATIDAGATQIVCHGTAATLTAATTGTQGTITWQPQGKTGSTIITDPILSSTVFTATLVYGGPLGCTVSDTVRVNHYPIVSITQIETDSVGADICLGTPITFSVTTQPANIPVTWTTNGIALAETTNTIRYSPRLPTDMNSAWFEMGAAITDANGCSASAEKFGITVKRCYDIPTAFTPNGDQSNDAFGLVNTDPNTEIILSEFRIFNRWGSEIFEATPGIQKWDGRVNEKDAPMDTYVYYMVIKFPDGSTEIRNGDVTLIR